MKHLFLVALGVMALIVIAACAVVPDGGGLGIGIDPFYHGYHHGW